MLTVLSIALGVLVVITITVFTGYFGAQEATSAPVTRDGQVVGLITLDVLERLLRSGEAAA